MTLLPHSPRTVSVLRTAAALLFTLVAFFTLPALPASAHNSLIASNPVADSVIAVAPTSITLTFNENVKDFSPLVAVTIGEGKPVEIVPRIDGSTITADLAGLDLPAAGADPALWRIGYRIVSADGHPVTGLLNFTVGDRPAETAAPVVEATTGADESNSGFAAPAAIIVGSLIICAGLAILVIRRRGYQGSWAARRTRN